MANPPIKEVFRENLLVIHEGWFWEVTYPDGNAISFAADLVDPIDYIGSGEATVGCETFRNLARDWLTLVSFERKEGYAAALYGESTHTAVCGEPQTAYKLGGVLIAEHEGGAEARAAAVDALLMGLREAPAPAGVYRHNLYPREA